MGSVTARSTDTVPPNASDKESFGRVQSPSMSLAGCGQAFDPFQTAPMILDSDVLKSLEYYRQRMLAPVVSGCWRLEASKSAITLRFCFHDPLLMQGVLLLANCHMEHIAGCQSALAKTLRYMVDGIQLVRQHTQRQELSSSLVFLIVHLCAAEGVRSSLDASILHLKAARTIVAELGGLQCLDDTTKMILITVDIFRAVHRLQKPTLPCSWDPGSAKQALSSCHTVLSHLEELSIVGTELCSLKFLTFEERAFKTHIDDLVEALRVWQHADSSKTNEKHIWDWQLYRFQAIQHRMLLSKQTRSDTEALRIAIIIWNSMVRSDWGARIIVKSTVQKLKAALMKCNRLDLCLTMNSTAWMLGIGAMATQNTAEQSWFKEQLHAFCGTWSQDELYPRLCNLFTQCLYFEPIQEERLQMLCISLRS
jgi:hypothetical protein